MTLQFSLRSHISARLCIMYKYPEELSKCIAQSDIIYTAEVNQKKNVGRRETGSACGYRARHKDSREYIYTNPHSRPLSWRRQFDVRARNDANRDCRSLRTGEQRGGLRLLILLRESGGEMEETRCSHCGA